jgi:hypothetical protein
MYQYFGGIYAPIFRENDRPQLETPNLNINRVENLISHIHNPLCKNMFFNNTISTAEDKSNLMGS